MSEERIGEEVRSAKCWGREMGLLLGEVSMSIMARTGFVKRLESGGLFLD